jgi:hypothetical protein
VPADIVPYRRVLKRRPKPQDLEQGVGEAQKHAADVCGGGEALMSHSRS